jgi:hypothetical protein
MESLVDTARTPNKGKMFVRQVVNWWPRRAMRVDKSKECWREVELEASQGELEDEEAYLHEE